MGPPRRKRLARVAVLTAVVGVLALSWASIPAYAQVPPECAWEWGGVPETSPAPCASPVPAHVTDTDLLELHGEVLLGLGLLVFAGGFLVVRLMVRA